MALKDLLKNLPNFKYYSGYGNFIQKSIPYGKDQPGGGSSNQPYIISPIKDSQNFDEGLIRGGILKATSNSLTDVERISKFYSDFARGPLFITKQVGLQLSNPRLEVNSNNDGLSNIISQATNGLIQSTRLYNLGVNTLAQIGATAFGVHFNRNGLSPIMDNDLKYYYTVRSNAGLINESDSFSKNRLVKLYNNNILQSGANSNGGIYTELSYLGGPDSTYGIGTTNIKRYVDTRPKLNNALLTAKLEDDNKLPITNDPIFGINKSTFFGSGSLSLSKKLFKYLDASKFSEATNIPNKNDSIIFSNRLSPRANRKTVKATDFKEPIEIITLSQYYNPKIKQDFRKNNTSFSSDISLESDYEQNNGFVTLPKRIGLGDPGRKSSKIRTSYADVDFNKIDKVNYTPIHTWQGFALRGEKDDIFTRDIIKFGFEIVNNDSPNLNTDFIVFRAFLNGIKDNFMSKWKDITYEGRGEEFYVYNGFKRSISFGFKISAQSASEMKPLYQKLNYLASSIAPDYGKSVNMKGNLIRLTIGDWLYRMPGILNSINFSIPDDASWEIALNDKVGTGTTNNFNGQGNDNDMYELPQLIEVSVDFTPIHNMLPRKGKTVPFITPLEKNKWGLNNKTS